jgi:GNAT superfamily N-acetyltransferase
MNCDALSDTAARARAWHHARHAVCDVIETWAHGTVVRATRYPDYYDLNAVRVEEDPAMSIEELVAFADEALFELAHRRLDFDLVDAAERMRGGLEANGWEATRLLWLRHEAPLPPGPDIAVEAVSYDAVQDLRLAWYRQDFPKNDPSAFFAQAREVDLSQEVQVLAVRERSVPVAFAQLHQRGAAAEITHVYVYPEQRGNLLGTALTRAAIDAAGAVRDLWIVADDEARPKDLYARLGFRPAWASMELTRHPS